MATLYTLHIFRKNEDISKNATLTTENAKLFDDIIEIISHEETFTYTATARPLYPATIYYK